LLAIEQRRREDFLKEFTQILITPEFPSVALEEFPGLLEKDLEKDKELSALFQPFPGLYDEILARVVSAREAKSRE